MNKKLTQKRLKELLHYDPETGVFSNNINRSSRALKGLKTGTDNGRGYIKIKINKKMYYAHRLAWLYKYGYSPENEIDHINRNKSDNRLCNLRHVSRVCNSQNSSISIRNKTGVTGVSFHKKAKKWIVQVRNNNNSVYVGIFDNFVNAVYSRWEAEKKYGYANCNTTSSSYNYLKDKGCLK